MAVKKKPTKKKKSTVKKAVKKVKAAKSKIKPAAKPKKKAATKKLSLKKKAKKGSGVDLECFLTNACVHYYQLPDDAYELQTLRKYRDNYLLTFGEGQQLVKRYYEVAPKIVKQIENDEHRSASYEFIYERIKKACREIELRALKTAKNTYKNMVLELEKRYPLTE